MNVIETQDLKKRYGSSRKGVRAVDGISFHVPHGQIFGFLGPNGSGKTTTIGMLLGIIEPTSGEVRLMGASGVSGLHAARQRVGATLETPNFYPYMSGLDNLRVVANVKGVDRNAIDAALDTVNLTDRRKHRFETYSLGMKQRLALAATLLGNPELLILDEPANGLDAEGMREVRDVILNFAASGKTVFLSSHLMAEVERTCTHVAIISKGRIVTQSSMRDITTSSVQALVRGGDAARLCETIKRFENVTSAEVRGGDVVVGLKSDDLAALNQFAAGQGIYLSHLALHKRPLEDVYMDLTTTEDA
ncbi:MAG TPA: ABC transporter ATP-binding protein [Longimicrobiales bacterium]|nr:ABC transporter ATP-binding protein [Longimicrobiales bacterium]